MKIDSVQDYFDYNRKHPLKPRSISSYKSYLKRVIIILDMEPNKFLMIKKPKELIKLFVKLQSDREFKSIPKKSQGNLKTAFRRYIQSIERLNDLKLVTIKYFTELTRAHQGVIKKNKHKKKDIELIVANLSCLFKPINSVPKWDKHLHHYLNLKSVKEMDRIFIVSQKLLQGRYNEMVFKHFEITAKVLAIKAHLQALG